MYNLEDENLEEHNSGKWKEFWLLIFEYLFSFLLFFYLLSFKVGMSINPTDIINTYVCCQLCLVTTPLYS